MGGSGQKLNVPAVWGRVRPTGDSLTLRFTRALGPRRGSPWRHLAREVRARPVHGDPEGPGRAHDVALRLVAARGPVDRRTEPIAHPPSVVSQKCLEHRGRRCARLARREEGEYREYLTDEQRSEPGCSDGRMPRDFWDTALGSGIHISILELLGSFVQDAGPAQELRDRGPVLRIHSAPPLKRPSLKRLAQVRAEHAIEPLAPGSSPPGLV